MSASDETARAEKEVRAVDVAVFVEDIGVEVEREVDPESVTVDEPLFVVDLF